MKNKIKKEFSAGGVVFREEPEGVLWLVIKPTGDDRWRFPKGKIERGESVGQAAGREVTEEAGIEVEVLNKVGLQKLFYYWDGQKISKTVVFFLMRYLQEARNGFNFETEAIDWLPFEEARQRLAFPSDKEVLDKAQILFGEVA